MLRRSARIAAFASAVLIPLLGSDARAASFYEGKTVDIIVGSDVGGGFDAYARLFARHLGRVISGSPAFVVRNMPGAGSAKAAQHIYAVAPKDGTVIGAFNPGGLLAPLFEGKDLGYDATKFQFLASADASARLCATLKRSVIKTFADAQTKRVVVGAAAVGTSTFDYPYLHRNIHGAQFEIVGGYKGTNEIMLAMERGEVEAVCGVGLPGLSAARADLVRSGGLNYLLKVSVVAEPELDALNVPDASTFAKTDQDRAVHELVAAQQLFARPYAVAPGVPAERVAELRKAFASVMQDAQFLAEADKSQLSIIPASGEQAQKTVERMYAAPKAVIEGAVRAIRP